MSYSVPVKHLNLNNLQSVKLGSNKAWEDHLKQLFDWNQQAGKKGVQPTQDYAPPKPLKPLGKNGQLGGLASVEAQGQSPIQPAPAPRVASIFTQPNAQPQPMQPHLAAPPQPQAPQGGLPQFLAPVAQRIGAPPM